ncbi:hypothetical protein DPV78_003994 [Talaromyces pinophilus]|nr:hypothetical protein DPV78_003994 [Talaromyces pinophilus]
MTEPAPTTTTGEPSPSTANQPSRSSSSSSTKSFFGRWKHQIRSKWTTDWAPLMKAKSNLDDDYNFVPGRYYGQGAGGETKETRA